MASCPFTSWQLDRERYGNSDLLNILGLQKSLQMVTAAMRLKDACSFPPLWKAVTNLESILKSRDITLLYIHKGVYSQSYDFSSSRVKMCEWYHKEG